MYSRRQQTVNEYLAGPESLNRQGLIWGAIVNEPAPNYTHQAIVTRIVVVLDDHVREHRKGLVCVSPLDVVLDEKRALIVQPDVVFISNARAAILRNQVWGAPDLVVEVESLSTRSHDRTAKRRWYRRYRVREYWLIDPIDAAVTIMGLEGPRSTRRRFHGERLLRSAVLPELRTTAAAIFD